MVFVECLLSSSFQPRYEYRQCTSTHQLLMDCRYIPTSRSCSSWHSYIVCIHYVYYGCKKGARKTAPRRRTILPTSLIECVIVCSYVFLILPLLSAEICSWGVKSAFCSANPSSCGVGQVSPSTCTSMELSGRSSTPIANGKGTSYLDRVTNHLFSPDISTRMYQGNFNGNKSNNGQLFSQHSQLGGCKGASFSRWGRLGARTGASLPTCRSPDSCQGPRGSRRQGQGWMVLMACGHTTSHNHKTFKYLYIIYIYICDTHI